MSANHDDVFGVLLGASHNECFGGNFACPEVVSRGRQVTDMKHRVRSIKTTNSEQRERLRPK